MRNVGRVVMILGIAIAFINYISYIGRTDTIMQQIFQAIETIMIMTGFYIFGKGISFTFSKSNRTIPVIQPIKKPETTYGITNKEKTEKSIFWTCSFCNRENSTNDSICEKCGETKIK